MKQIMERTSVVMDVDSDKGEIQLTGSQKALDLATKEIRRITEAVEEDVQVPPALVEYLTTRVCTMY
jgi:polyribonucleotide nucleotidyltransferase